MELFVNGAAVVAITELIKNLFGEKVGGYITIVVAALIGVAYAYVAGTDLLTGAVTGLAAAGVVKVGKDVGGK